MQTLNGNKNTETTFSCSLSLPLVQNTSHVPLVQNTSHVPLVQNTSHVKSQHFQSFARKSRRTINGQTPF